MDILDDVGMSKLSEHFNPEVNTFNPNDILILI